MNKKEIKNIYKFHIHLLEIYCHHHPLFKGYLEYLKQNKIIIQYSQNSSHTKIQKSFDGVNITIEFDDEITKGIDGTMIYIYSNSYKPKRYRISIIFKSGFFDSKELIKKYIEILPENKEYDKSF